MEKGLPAGNGPLGSTESNEDVRVGLGYVVKRLKSLWRVGVCLSALLPMRDAVPLGVDATESLDDVPDAFRDLLKCSNEEAQATRLAVCEGLESAICVFKLDDAYQWKLPLDGREVMETVGITEAGPEVKRWVDAATRWQLAHPDGTKEECREFLRRSRNAPES